MKVSRYGLQALLIGVAGAVLAAQAPPPLASLTQDELFKTTKVWTAHLKFSADAWKEIQPIPGPPTGRSRMTGGEWLQGAPGNRNGWAATRGIAFNYTKATLEFENRAFREVAVRVKGNGTFNANVVSAVKTSFKVDLNKHVKGQKLAGVSTLNFHNNFTDVGWVNEPLAYRLFNDAGVPAPRTAYVRMYLTVEGLYDRRYVGLYSLVENIDDNFLQARYGTRDGVLLKPTTIAPFSDLGDDWAAYVQSYDAKTDLAAAEQRRIIEFCRFVTSASDAEFAARIGSYVDLELFARFMAVTGWLNNWDSILKAGQNYYVFMHPATRRLHFLPWDHDHSWGTFFQQPPGSHPIGRIDPPWPEPVRFLDRMFAVPAFRDAYFARMREFTDTIFAPDRFPPQLREIAAVIRPALLDEPPKTPNGPRSTSEGQLAQFDEVISGDLRVMPFARDRATFVRDELTKLGR